MPSHVLGIMSLVVLLLAMIARYARHLAGVWRSTYVINAVLALFFNVFVLVAQLFAKVPALKAMAPTQSEPPFLVAELAVLVIFVTLGILGVKRFRDQPVHSAALT
jgi:hypothetical protein